MFRTAACPGYSEIRLALMPYKRLSRLIDDFQPEVVHIATEGPLGWAARRWCGRNGRSFTTAFHTRFPEYVALRTGLPASRSEEHTSELQSLMSISYAVFCLK